MEPLASWFWNQPKEVLTIVTWWYIWKSRNAIIFESQPFHPHLILGKILRPLHEHNIAGTILNCPNNRSLPPATWSPPPANTHKLNVDGSFNPNARTAGIGGILRDAQGTIVQGFAAKIIAASPLEAELHALLRGIQVCNSTGVREVIIKGDSFIIWDSMSKDEGVPWTLMPLWKRIQLSIKSLARWRVDLIRWPANSILDHLTKLGPSKEIIFRSSLPIHIQQIYLLEKCVREFQGRSSTTPYQEHLLLQQYQTWSKPDSFWIRRSKSFAWLPNITVPLTMYMLSLL